MSLKVNNLKTSSTKEVVVLIPHYNNYEGLKIAVKNIREDIPLDILVVDDGSSKDQIKKEDLLKIIPSHYGLILLEMSKNKGIEHALNEGLVFAKKQDYTYIARLDCDDLCREGRLKKQINFLKKNPEIAIVGSQVQFINKAGGVLFKIELPTQDNDIRRKMYLNAMLIHPTILFKKSILEEIDGYPVTYEAAEDYAFYWEILKRYKMANMDEVLVDCLIDENGISTLKRKKQLKSRIQLIKENFKWGLYPVWGLLKANIALRIPFGFLLKLKKITYGQ